MSDARLRELERRWKETDAPDDEAAFLLERVRVGELTRARLELAAYCGDAAALVLTGPSASGAPSSDVWLSRLHEWGPVPMLVAADAALCVAWAAADEHDESANVARLVSATIGPWLDGGCAPPPERVRELRDSAWTIFHRSSGARMVARAASTLAGYSLAPLEGRGLVVAPLTPVMAFLRRRVSTAQVGQASAPRISAWAKRSRSSLDELAAAPPAVAP